MRKGIGLKQGLAIALALVMVLAAFAGCGATPAGTDSTGASQQPASATPGATQAATAAPESQKPITLQFWTISLRPTFDDFFNGLFKQYQTDNPNITIQWTDLPYDQIQNKMITSAAAGNAPDVVNLNTEMTLILAGKGVLVNLEDVATPEQIGEYQKTLFESTRTSKGVFAFPWYGAPSVMIYNKTLFDKAGITTIPATFDEMLTAGAAMKEKTGATFYIPDDFASILQLEGIKLISDDKTKATFNTPETLAILQKYKKAVDDGIIGQVDYWGAWDKMLQQFDTGKLAIINSGTQSVKRIKDEAPDIYKNIDVAPSMVGKAGIIRNPVMNVVVPQLSKNVKEAVNFAYYVTDDANQLAFAKTVAIFPSTVKAAADPFFTSDTSTVETKAISIAAGELPKTADITLAITKGGEVTTEINKVAQAVILSNADPQKALSDAETNVNAILASIAGQ